MGELEEILRDTADYVSWKLEEGEKTAEVSRSILQELGEGVSKAGNVVREVAPQQASSRSETTKGASAGQRETENKVVESMSKATDASKSLEDIAARVRACSLCPLHADRTQAVPGQGNPNPEILFVGEAPGADEDKQGLAFVGRAGKLLTKMIEAMGLSREEVFIANVNKCRPPKNRKPLREEMDACLPYLRQQVAVLKPRVIVALGATAVEGLVPESIEQKISELRGNWLSFEGIPLMPTYHPAYLLRNAAMKKPVWEDLKAVLHHLGRPVPKRSAAK